MVVLKLYVSSFYILKLQMINYLLLMVITRLKNDLSSIEFEGIGY
jgi:hypothetical protein